MKKNLFFAALALVALASCSDEQFVGEIKGSPDPGTGPEQAIMFNSGAYPVTRATWTGGKAAELLNNNFVFAGVKGDGSAYESTTPYVFDQYNANWYQNTANTTESNSNDWEYVGFTPASTTSLPSGVAQTIKYWDYGTTQYDFAAYSLGKGDGSTPTYATPTKIDFTKLGTNNAAYTLTGSAEQLKACYISDLVTAYKKTANSVTANDYGKVVTFSFRSLSTKIRLAFFETVPGYSVQDILFYPSSQSDATASTTPTLFASSAVLPYGSGTMSVSFPNTGWNKSPNGPEEQRSTDYNKAHVTFSATNSQDLSSTLPFTALADFANPEMYEGAVSTKGWIGRSSSTATYAGGLEDGVGKYFTILPYETGASLNLRIKYTLVSTDGSAETMTVDNATAIIPAELASWKPNYAYTYLFKISDMTNGSTGFGPDGTTPVQGLTPITLNAVVVDSEDGLQETITTVSAPSITTYMAGKVVTDNDEYKANGTHPIFIVVNNGSDNVALTAGTNAKLYTAVLDGTSAESGTSAINPISEEAVDNALRYGVITTTTTTDDTYTVTDANGWNLVVTDLGTYAANNTGGLTGGVTTIPAEESPTGDAVNVTCAKFVPTAPTSPATVKYYVFQYKGETSGHYGSYSAVEPRKLTSGSYYTLSVSAEQTATGSEPSTASYYIKDGDNYVKLATAPAVGTKYYTLAPTTNAASTANPLVVTATSMYYTKEDIYEPVTGDLPVAGQYFYYGATGYTVYNWNGSDPVPAQTGGYYTKGDTYKAVEYKKLTIGTYYTSNRGAGKFTVTANDVVYVDAENKYYTETGAEVDAKYMYKIIKVVN